MSQSETIMLIVLGFAIALVVVLLFGRLAWNISQKLGAKRYERSLPANILELQAERDRLRAEQAMMARKLELRLEDVKMRMAEQMAEVSRNRNRVEIMTKEIATRDETIIQHVSEIDRGKTALANQDIELKSRAEIIERLSSVVNAKDVEITKLTKDMILLSSTLRDKTAKLATVGAELESSVRLAAKINPDDSTTEDRIRRRISEMTVISNQMTAQHDVSIGESSTPSPITQVFEDSLEEKLAYAERQTQELDAELKRLDAVWSDKLLTMSSEEAEQKEEPAKKRGGLNVISLAQRIRALQKSKSE